MNEETLNSTAEPGRASLNEHQARRLRITCEHIDRQLGEIERVLAEPTSRSAFPRNIADISPAQRRTIEDYIARARVQLVRVLSGLDVPVGPPSIPASRSIRVVLSSLDDAAEELRPNHMRGYGEMPPSVATELSGVASEIQSLVRGASRYLAEREGQDLRTRLEELEQAGNDLGLLSRIERVVADRGLVEFRGPIAAILDRAGDRTFECAVFGRVSSGKSSLLNAVLGVDLLPVGVTPITAVPTRLVYGQPPSLCVERAGAPAESVDLARLADFTTEQRNPGNAKHVTRLVVHLPSPRLRGGVGFMDTPGLGSLATHGAEETLAYLPQCDLGLVLVDTGSTLTDEDVGTVLALLEAAVPVQVLLSKADILSAEDCATVVRYTAEHLAGTCNCTVPVYPVSTRPTHRYLVDCWFDEEILQLYGRARELRAASVQRKIAALRASVVAALRLRLERSDRAAGAVPSNEVRALEARLRQASGAIAEAKDACAREVDAMGADLPAVFGKAAARAFAEGRSPGEVVRASLIASAQGPARRCRTLLTTLARRLQEDLRQTAAALGLDETGTDGDLVPLVRSLPVFDPGSLETTVASPRAGGMLVRRFAERQMAERIRREIGPRVEAAVAGYRQVLKEWTRQVTDDLSERFELEAQRYRALAGTAIAGATLTPEERKALEADLRDLGASPPPGPAEAMSMNLTTSTEDEVYDHEK